MDIIGRIEDFAARVDGMKMLCGLIIDHMRGDSDKLTDGSMELLFRLLADLEKDMDATVKERLSV